MTKSSDLMQVPTLLDEVALIKKWGKGVFDRRFGLPDGSEETLLIWGGLVTPSIVFPLTRDNRVIAIKQFRYAAGKAGEVILELPGGVPEEDGELDVSTASRELTQETGYAGERFVKLGALRPLEPAGCITLFQPILALGCRKVGEPEPDRLEFFEVVTYSLQEWIDMLARDEVRDPKSVAVTMLALHHLGAKVILPGLM